MTRIDIHMTHPRDVAKSAEKDIKYLSDECSRFTDYETGQHQMQKNLDVTNDDVTTMITFACDVLLH